MDTPTPAVSGSGSRRARCIGRGDIRTGCGGSNQSDSASAPPLPAEQLLDGPAKVTPEPGGITAVLVASTKAKASCRVFFGRSPAADGTIQAVSSEYSEQASASNATDGDPATEWSTNATVTRPRSPSVSARPTT